MKKNKQTTEATTVLEVTKRTVFGKKLKQLRKTGLIPSNIFGTSFASQSISANLGTFTKVYKKVKETGIVYLALGEEKIPTLITTVQKHPVTSQILHVDFRKVDLTIKITTDVPVHLTGTSEAVAQKGGVLLTLSEKLLIEALPQDIPSSVEVDISSLKEVGQEIKVKDLAQSKTYEIKEDAEKVIVSVTAHKEESVVAETTAGAAPEVITAKPEEGTEAESAPAPESEKKPDSAEKKEEKT